MNDIYMNRKTTVNFCTWSISMLLVSSCLQLSCIWSATSQESDATSPKPVNVLDPRAGNQAATTPVPTAELAPLTADVALIREISASMAKFAREARIPNLRTQNGAEGAREWRIWRVANYGNTYCFVFRSVAGENSGREVYRVRAGEAPLIKELGDPKSGWMVWTGLLDEWQKQTTASLPMVAPDADIYVVELRNGKDYQQTFAGEHWIDEFCERIHNEYSVPSCSAPLR